MQTWQPAYLGVGSNLSDPRQQVEAAIERLAALPRTRRVLVSPLYCSRPFGPVPQPDFVNAAVGVLTQLSAEELLAQLRALETSFGRPAERARWGPRVLDLDLLLYGDRILDEPGLIVPHPFLQQRLFVLEPLAELAPAARVPGLGTVASLLAGLQSGL